MATSSTAQERELFVACWPLPQQPVDPSRLTAAFENFGLPERLD